MTKVKYRADMIIQGELPSVENIERWRKYIKRESRVESHQILDAIFDCALVGLERVHDSDKLAKQMLKDSLRELARSIRVKR